MITKFRKTGSLLDKNRNRQKSVLTPGILQDIQTAITRSPHKSSWKLSIIIYCYSDTSANEDNSFRKHFR